MTGSYDLEYKKNGIYHPVLDESGKYYKSFKTIAGARKYAMSMFRKDWYDLVAVFGGGKYLGIDKVSGKKMYEGRTAGIITCEFDSNGNRVFVYQNYINGTKTILKKDGTTGRRY